MSLSSLDFLLVERDNGAQQGPREQDARRYLIFRIGDASFAVDILDVQRVLRPKRTSPLPRAPAFVEGVTTIRGVVVPVIALRKRFRLSGSRNSEDERLLLVGIANQTVGLLVDSATEIAAVPPSAFQPAPPLVQGIAGEYVVGVADWDDRMLIQLDLARLLSPEEIASLAELTLDSQDNEV
jgi:purine-binding chemotaxis protein CheW